MSRDVIIACDFSSKEETLRFLEKLGERRPFVKIGMELYYAEGPAIVRELKARGHKVFLDLKLHDIPNTVGKAMKVLSKMDIDMCNVHALGTVEMMEAAICGLEREDGSRPLLIAVTQLTSTTQEQMESDQLIEEPMERVVAHYAYNAKVAGLDGVVCSPLEAEKVHGTCGEDFLTVTPGVRFAEDEKGDQARVTTPAKARELSSDYIVVGRSITGAKDPLAAYERCMAEFLG
ncbi:MAG: orotidine-5'-phosphate decarboxylase [Bacillota bacterium]|nr:orotidine-5'-phosphate decarboxylase [Bacillota bacterium]